VGHHNEIHVLHRNSSEDPFIPYDDGASESDAILEPSFDGANAGYHALGSVCQSDFLLPFFPENQLKADVLGNAQID
jgi:hypothetical protein